MKTVEFILPFIVYCLSTAIGFGFAKTIYNKPRYKFECLKRNNNGDCIEVLNTETGMIGKRYFFGAEDPKTEYYK